MIYPNFRHFLSIDLFVFKSTDSKLFFFVQRLLDRWVFHPEFGKCIARKIEMFANIAYGLPLIKHRNNDLSILDQYVHLGIATVAPSQNHSLRTP